MKNKNKNTNREEKMANALVGAYFIAMLGIVILSVIEEAKTAEKGNVFSDRFAEQMEDWNQEWNQNNGTRKCHNRDYQAFIMPKINEYFGIVTEEKTED